MSSFDPIKRDLNIANRYPVTLPVLSCFAAVAGAIIAQKLGANDLGVMLTSLSAGCTAAAALTVRTHAAFSRLFRATLSPVENFLNNKIKETGRRLSISPTGNHYFLGKYLGKALKISAYTSLAGYVGSEYIPAVIRQGSFDFTNPVDQMRVGLPIMGLLVGTGLCVMEGLNLKDIIHMTLPPILRNQQKNSSEPAKSTRRGQASPKPIAHTP